jgi:hypothetical protein
MLTRRQLLARSAAGFGGFAFSALASNIRQPHFAAKAKSVIFLYMDGGPSQLDTFDPKPRLRAEHGKPLPFKAPQTQFNNNGNIMGSPWEFKQHGQSGLWVSELFPHVAGCADDLCVVRSMVSDHSEHTAANYMLHTGFGMQGRPSMGSWLVYGLGSESENLPGFVVLDSGLIPAGGMDNFGSGFLPATYQATLFRRGEQPVANIKPLESTAALQRDKLALAKSLNAGVAARVGSTSEMDAMLDAYEMAYRMQSAVPDLADLTNESAVTRELYGVDDPLTAAFGRQCLLARRLVERGVRFVQAITPPIKGADRWDQHSGLMKGHTDNARAVDQPVAGLLKDLKSRGLLDQTLVLWGGEFGRTPMSQGSDGRDHNPFGYTMWMAGGGTRPGTAYGSTDDYGYFVAEGKVHVHDLHATMLHLLGLNHKQLTYRYSGRDMRLTDVHGEVIGGLMA